MHCAPPRCSTLYTSGDVVKNAAWALALDRNLTLLLPLFKMLSLEPNQFKVLANFFADFAKGLVLAAIIGQGFVGEASGPLRVISSLIWVTLACISLYFALYFTKEAKL